MRFIRSAVLILVSMGLSSGASAQATHSKVDVKVAMKDGSLALSFTISPEAGNVVNAEAPWKIELKKFDGLKVEAPLLKGDEVVKSLPTVIMKASPVAASGTAEWTVTAFVCSKDKTSCFRDAHSGKVEWKR